ncbi:MAG: hypothetical protein ABW086_08605 [Sedimenticola sp.]
MPISNKVAADIKRAHLKSQTHPDRNAVASAANTLGGYLTTQIFKINRGRKKRTKTAGKGIEAAIIWAYNECKAYNVKKAKLTNSTPKKATYDDVAKKLKAFTSEHESVPIQECGYEVWVEDGEIVQSPKDGCRFVALRSLPSKLSKLRNDEGLIE